MNVLVVGYGSIGRRHLLNLTKLDGVDEIAVYTKIKDDSERSYGKKVTFIDASTLDLSDACEGLKIDFSIIANETCKHIDTAITLARKGHDLFIEKPLSHTLEKIDRLEELSRRKPIKIFVAYNLRFLPAIQSIKERLSREVIGKLYFAEIEAGQSLPGWRKNIPYRDSYSAKAEQGGGVALDLSHEVDYMRYLFGEPCQWKTLKSKASDLEINSDDLFEGIYQYRNGLLCHVHLDYLQTPAKRRIRIEGSRGTIDCDLIGGKLKILSEDQEIIQNDGSLFSVENTYMDELLAFIEAIRSGLPPAISLADGVKALKLLGDGHA
jgi:predicted dehydrogenase